MEGTFSTAGVSAQEVKTYINTAAQKSAVDIEILPPGTPMIKGAKGEEDVTRLDISLKIGTRKTLQLLDVPCLAKHGQKGIQLGAEVLSKLGLDPKNLLTSVFEGRRRNHMTAKIGDETSTGTITFLGGEEFNASAEENETPPDPIVNARTGEWSPEEDLELWKQIDKKGNQWSLMAARLPGRHGDQVKHRSKELLYKYAGIPRRVGNLDPEAVRKRNRRAARIRLGSLMDVPAELGTPVKRRKEFEVATSSQSKSTRSRSRAHKKTRRTDAPVEKSIKKVKVLLKKQHKESTGEEDESRIVEKLGALEKRLMKGVP